MSRRRKRNKGLKSINQIDVTPLTDLTFILLVVFMLTAPVLERSINVNPPQMNSGEIKADKNNRVINITAEGSIVYEGQSFGKDELVSYVTSEIGSNPKLNFFIRADKVRPYGDVIDLLAVLHASGIDKASLITEVQN